MDLRELDARLQDAAAAAAALRGVDAELRSVATELQQLRSSEERWRRQAARAADALRASAGLSPGALWRRLTGRAAAARAEHEAKIAEARREQEEIDARMAPLLARQEELLARRPPLSAGADGLAPALAAKEAAVRERGGEWAERAGAAAAALDRLQREQRRVERTLDCAREAEAALVEARDRIGRARHVGEFDLVGDRLTAARGRSMELEVARGYLDRGRRALQHVADALGDEAATLAALDLGAGVRLTDLVADPFVSRLLHGAVLSDAHASVRDFVGRLRDVIHGLERQVRMASDACAAAADERARWLCSVRLD